MKKSVLFVPIFLLFILTSCDWMNNEKSSDQIESEIQDQSTMDAVKSVGQPSIKNWRELRILKDIYELCDQDGVVTYTYIFSEMTGKYTYVGETIGYGIPYATQYSSPQKVISSTQGTAPNARLVVPQAEPNKLYKPVNAEGTWILMLDRKNKIARPQYIESRICTYTFKQPKNMVINPDYVE